MPSGLAYRVYQRRAPSSVKLSTGTNASSERPSPTLPPERSEPSTLVITSAKSVTRRLRTTRHNLSRSCSCTGHPGRLVTPKGAETYRRAGSRLPKNALVVWPGHWRVSTNPRLAPRSRTSALDASIDCAPNRGIRGFVIVGSRRRCCHRLRAATSDPVSPPDSTDPSYAPRETITHAPYPIGWIHRHRRQLPAVDTGSSARTKMSSFDPQPENARPMCGSAGTLP
jgi:hypothetical protein